MNKISFFAVLLMLTVTFLSGNTSCSSSSSSSSEEAMETETLQCDDSAAHAYLSMNIQLPLASDEASSAIRQKLLEDMGNYLTRVTSYESGENFPMYSGDEADSKAILEYYKTQLIELFGRESQQDADERASYLKEDSTLSDDERSSILAEMPKWEYNYRLEMIADTTNYVVFLSQDYIYMGGAHGGVSGNGALTFDKQTGEFIEHLIDSTAVEALQPLLIEGLQQYYADSEVTMTKEELLEHLLIEGDQIPLPAYEPYPSKDGLVFVYQQYEIASYAEGMPSFVIPYDKIAPFMTPEAKKVCGVNTK